MSVGEFGIVWDVGIVKICQDKSLFGLPIPRSVLPSDDSGSSRTAEGP